MSTTEQKALALWLADRLIENAEIDAAEGGNLNVIDLELSASAELRRLSAENEALRAQVEALTKHVRPVYLVATGEVHEGQETYTRHDAPVPLADQEVLFTRPPEPLTRPAVPEGWKHDCAALLLNDVELWIDACPHCGKPRPALAAAPQPPVEVARPAVPEATGIEKIMLVVDAYAEVWAAAQDPTSDDAFGHLEAQRKALEEAITRFAAPQPEAQPTEAAQPDPCPGCTPSSFCKKPTCGRLLALQKGGA